MAQDNQRFINSVSWSIRTCAFWRDVPPEYGGWKIHTEDFAVAGKA
ncbi:MAG: hypothetical protein LBP19_10370 [Treponema sp.]|nr:hypothetical protein [Treponema sp.]